MGKKLECQTCGYSWLRPDGESKPICPKCQQPFAGGPDARAPGEASTVKAAASSACESESGKCPKAKEAGGPHQFKFGKCSNCGKGEGKLLKKSGAVANPGGANECAKGGKCMFMFNKCKKCKRSEFGNPATSEEAAGLKKKKKRAPSAGRRAKPKGNKAEKEAEATIPELLAALGKLDIPVTNVEVSADGPCMVTVTADDAGQAKVVALGDTAMEKTIKQVATKAKEHVAASAAFKLTSFTVDVAGYDQPKFAFEKA